MLDPLAFALKFGFLLVLYLFLVWVCRSGFRDLRKAAQWSTQPHGGYGDATGMYAADARLEPEDFRGVPRLRVEIAAGLPHGAAYDLSNGAVIGRGDDIEITLDDSFASSHHARVVAQGDTIVLEDLGSTNGTYLNNERLTGPRPLRVGDKIRIGNSEFTFER
jgi:hypothetical protein